jgi:hypothetical protein
MRGSYAVAWLFLVGCSGSNAAGGATPSQSQPVVCAYPDSVQTDAGDSADGCFAGPPGKICQVSNGATVLPDGGVSGGSETCTPLCAGSQYELSCRSQQLTNSQIPSPDPTLNCQAIAIPTPSNALFWCCPCAQ